MTFVITAQAEEDLQRIDDRLALETRMPPIVAVLLELLSANEQLRSDEQRHA